MGIENLQWLADLMNVELYDMLNGNINIEVLKKTNPRDYDIVAKANRIFKNQVKMEKLLKKKVLK